MSGLPTAPDEQIGFQPPPLQPPPTLGWPKTGIPIPSLPIIGTDPIMFNPVITMLQAALDMWKPKALDEAVKTARKKIPEFMDKLNIHDDLGFLVFANDLLKWTPEEDYDSKKIYDILCMFYYIIDQEPLKSLQTPIHPEQTGKPLTWLSAWIVVYCQLIGGFMDTPASWTPKSEESFRRAGKYNFDEADRPKGGWKTFNEFFGRKLVKGARPIDSPEDDKVIVYPADCTFDDSIPKSSLVDISDAGLVTIKGLPWTISSLLQGSHYASEFHGGVWMHAFLNTFNYHRQHAPVSGKVLEAKNIQGCAYLEVNDKCEPVRKMCVPHTKACGLDAPDTPGYQFLQTRGMVILDNPTLGKVAVLPIGMAMVSSVKLTVHEGQEVKKGDEISYFQFGGSDVICVFQAKARLNVDHFVASKDDTYSKMGTVLARAP